jgi:hypothetical protein
MKTRSQTKYENSALFDVNIDFEYSSKCWRENKIDLGNGMYRYICQNKKKCNCKCLPGENFCKKHIK